MNKPKIALPILVEGKYDKIKLDSLFDAHVIATGGFEIFNDEKKRALLRRVATGAGGIIVACDSDGAGKIIRGHVNGLLPTNLIRHVYIPKIAGKERRKTEVSKEGTVGVEGVPADKLRELFAQYVVRANADLPPRSANSGSGEAVESAEAITKMRLYEDGFTGKDGSAERRKSLCAALGLPDNLTVPALLGAINSIGVAAYESAVKRLSG